VTAYVLVHSPVVGPATWEPVARELRNRGHPAVVPALSPPVGLRPPYLPTHATEVVAAVRGSAHGGEAAVILAGHSGAGPRLPAIGRQLRRAGFPVAAYMFVDAGLPSDGATPRSTAPAEFVDLLDSLATGGRMLPRWSEWWGDGALARIVPDAAVRATLEAELRPVPVDLFDEPVPVPARWPDAPCGYVSFTYEHEAVEAEARGWPVVRHAGDHLALVTQPAVTAHALEEVRGRLGVT
jgi:thioesterase domain-containing protein